MCLAVPGRVLSIDPDDPMKAEVDFWGIRRTVRLDVLDEPVVPGDYVLNHVGFALRRVPIEEAEETLALFRQVMGEAAHLEE